MQKSNPDRKAFFQLDEVLSAANFLSLPLRQLKAEISKTFDQPFAICGGLLDEKLRLLRRIGNPSKIAPEFPMKRYLTSCRLNASRISSACLYSNAPIAQPVGQVIFAPLPVLFHAIERPVLRIVQNGFVRMNEGIAHMLFQRPSCRRLKLLVPFLQLPGLDGACHSFIVFGNERIQSK